MEKITEIKGFFGEYRFLSNFTPVSIEFEGFTYPSVEHAYVAAKTINLEDRELIRSVVSPGKVKIVGKRVVLRPGWDDMKVPLMKEFVEQKFNFPIYKELLLKTEDAYLEETNTWRDYFWGVCDGFGQNILGKILMEKRDKLRKLNT